MDVSLHLGPNFFISPNTATPDTKHTIPRIVNSHPFPIALIMGEVTMTPTQEKMLRMKLLSATPDEDLRGSSSVSMVVTRAKMSMLAAPKKKFAIICE